MATKPKTEAPKKDDGDEEKEEGDGKEGAPAKKGLVGMILGPILALPSLPMTFLRLPLMKKLIYGGGTLAVLLIGGAAYYFLMPAASQKSEAEAGESVKTAPPNLPTQEATFFSLPDIIVNIQTPDASPAFLKLSVALELEKPELKPAVEAGVPRVIDQFQSYLRELRLEDIRGSAGVMRLKEELLRRVNLAVAPTPVRDVLLKEMIVQ